MSKRDAVEFDRVSRTYLRDNFEVHALDDVTLKIPDRVLDKQQSRLVIPAKAIEHEGSKSYVWTVRGGTATRVSIVQGGETQSGVEVRQGLEDGDVVVVAPPANLTDGQKVRAAVH